MTTYRVIFYGGPRDGQVATLSFSTPRDPPDPLYVFRSNPGLILVSLADADPAIPSRSFVVYRRTGQQTADGAEIYSCLA